MNVLINYNYNYNFDLQIDSKSDSNQIQFYLLFFLNLLTDHRSVWYDSVRQDVLALYATFLQARKTAFTEMEYQCKREIEEENIAWSDSIGSV